MGYHREGAMGTYSVYCTCESPRGGEASPSPFLNAALCIKKYTHTCTSLIGTEYEILTIRWHTRYTIHMYMYLVNFMCMYVL